MVKKKILINIFFVVLFVLNLFFIFNVKILATDVIKNENILSNINNVTNQIILNSNIINENYDAVVNSQTLFHALENKNIVNEDEFSLAVEASKIGDDVIIKRVKDYENEQEKIKVKSQMKSRGGMIGRLKIPDVGFDVALIRASIYNGSHNQAVVDAKDSAAWIYDWGDAILIADHNNQGFELMKASIPNKTKAYINNGDTIKTYICTKNIKGHNTGSSITDLNYRRLNGDNDGGLIMYTCNENWRNITITYWKEI